MRYLLLLCMLLGAEAVAQVAALPAVDLEEVSVRQEQIRAEIRSAPDEFRGLSPSEQQQVLERSESVSHIIAGKESWGELDDAERASVMATLDWIDVTLDKAKAAELVCSYERVVGSNRKTRVCRSAAHIEAEREETRRLLSKPGVCAPGTPGCSMRN
jgi:hypothetical protein